MRNSSQPIGVFDSGIGGLIVVNAIAKHLANESIIYFGDTAHAPWGDKSNAAVQAYSIKICNMLLNQNCKLILIACNTASAAAGDLIREYVGKKAIVMNVIDPMINHLREHHPNELIGLIATRLTVHSNVYKKKLDELNSGIQLRSLATPLLVPLIEEGLAEHQIMMHTIQEYLSHPDLENIHTLILGSTHYPIIKPHIQAFYENKIAVIDSAEIVSHSLKALLEYHNLLNRSANTYRVFYVSDYTDTFAHAAKLFFSDVVQLERYPLWD